MVIKLSGAFRFYYLLLKYGPLPLGIGFGTGLIGNFGGGDFLYGPLPPPPTEGDPLYGALLLMFLLSSASYADNQSSESWFSPV